MEAVGGELYKQKSTQKQEAERPHLYWRKQEMKIQAECVRESRHLLGN